LRPAASAGPLGGLTVSRTCRAALSTRSPARSAGALLAADQRQQQAQHESEILQKIDFAFAHPRYAAWPYPHGRGQPRCARRSDDTDARKATVARFGRSHRSAQRSG
jgi:hypothetical protein